MMSKLKGAKPFVYEDLPELLAARSRLAEIEREVFGFEETRSRLLEQRASLAARTTELEVRQLVGEDVASELATTRAELEQVERALADLPARFERLQQAKRYLEQEVRRLEEKNRQRKWEALAPHYAAAVRELADALARAKEANDRVMRLLAQAEWDVPGDWPREWHEFVTERGNGYINRSRYELWVQEADEFLTKWG
jgi:chromosome segregation ATPase